MNSTGCYIQCANPEELAQKQLESQQKKKKINQKYYQKKKQQLEELEKIKEQLGVKQADFSAIQNALLARDQIISSIQTENKRKEQEYTNLLREKDAEIDRMRIELENEIRDNSRERIIREVGQQIALMNERIGRLEVCENRVKQLQKEANNHEGWYYFLIEMNKYYQTAIDEVFIRLQKQRLIRQLEPPSLDKLVANGSAVLAKNMNYSPPPVTQQYNKI
jgi:chromosome segregation ATPase